MTYVQYFITFLICVAVAWELTNVTKAVLSKRWPTTNGNLDEWDMSYEDGGDTVNFRIRHIAYSYTVRGEQYSSNKLGHGFPSWLGSEMVNPTIERVFKNSPSLKVHFHPTYPATSVLTVGLKRYHLFRLFTSAIALVFMITSIRDV